MKVEKINETFQKIAIIIEDEREFFSLKDALSHYSHYCGDNELCANYIPIINNLLSLLASDKK